MCSHIRKLCNLHPLSTSSRFGRVIPELSQATEGHPIAFGFAFRLSFGSGSRRKGPSYRVAKNLFSENLKSRLGFDWSECQHVNHGDFDTSEILFSAKKSWGTLYLIFWLSVYSKFHLSRDTHENTRASTHSSVPRKMSNPPPDQQIAPRGTRNQHIGQLLSLIHI